MSKPKPYGRLVVGLAITGLFTWLLMRQVDAGQIAAAMTRIDGLAVLAALACLAAGYTTRIIRWWMMLRAVNPQVRLSACAWPFLVSIALNNLLPFRAGDAIRVVGFRKQLNAPGARLLGTLLIERLLDVIVLLAIFFIGVRGVTGSQVPDTFVRIAAAGAAIAVAGLVGIVLLSPYADRLTRWLAGWPTTRRLGVGDAVQRHGTELFDLLHTLRSPGLATTLLLLSALGWAFEGGVFVSIAYGLGLDVGARGPWFALATGTLATVLPSSPGYVGTFDYFVVLGLTAYGAPADAAAAFAIVVHLVIWLPLTITGLTYFLRPAHLRLDGLPTVSAPEARP